MHGEQGEVAGPVKGKEDQLIKFEQRAQPDCELRDITLSAAAAAWRLHGRKALLHRTAERFLFVIHVSEVK